MPQKLSCSARNHLGCGAYKANLENLAGFLNSTPEKIEAILKNSKVFQNYEGCWGSFTQKIIKNPKNINLLKRILESSPNS